MTQFSFSLFFLPFYSFFSFVSFLVCIVYCIIDPYLIKFSIYILINLLSHRVKEVFNIKDILF